MVMDAGEGLTLPHVWDLKLYLGLWAAASNWYWWHRKGWELLHQFGSMAGGGGTQADSLPSGVHQTTTLAYASRFSLRISSGVQLCLSC